MDLLTFHKDLASTKDRAVLVLIAVSSGVLVLVSSVLGAVSLEPPAHGVAVAALQAALVVRLLVPFASAIRVIVADALSPAGATAPEALRSWGPVASVLQAAVWVVTVLAFLSALGFDMSGYLTGLGLSSIAAAFAAQRTLAEVFATAALLADRPFSVGDRIVFKGVEAKVVRIGFRSTFLATTYSGEAMCVPNSELVQGIVLNKTLMRERRVKARLHVCADTAVDRLDAAHAAITDAVRAAPHANFIAGHLFDLTLDGFLFEYVYTVPGNDSQQYRDAQHAINLGIVRNLGAAGVRLARRPAAAFDAA